MPTIVNGVNTPTSNLSNEEATVHKAKESGKDVAPEQPVKQTVTPTYTTNQAPIPTTIINNPEVPVVVFVGPPASGKSMILVRLAKYLRSQGYTLKTDDTFLNTQEYQEGCEKFKDSLNTVVALDGSVEYLLVSVYKNGREVAKLLEAPGEDFYTTDPEKIKQGKNNRIEPYLATIMTSRNPKSYVMLLDLDSPISFRKDEYHRSSYIQRFLTDFYSKVNKDRDRIVLLYNKIDVTMWGSINGCENPQQARKDAELYYRELFAKMKVPKLAGFITLDNFVFKTFCTGMFAQHVDSQGREIQTYNIADDIYPRELWNEITKKW